MNPGFDPIKRRRLSDEVSAQIQVRIASGELRSGDKLPPERELATRFGVSRGAVREALRTLERTGLVSLQAGSRGGAFIGQGNPGLIGDSFRNLYQLGSVSLEELTEARQWVESAVVRVAAERATEQDLAALTANVDEAERLFIAKRYDDKIDVHVEFHNLLARATHNAVMMMVMGALMEVMRDFAHAVGGERNDLTIKARRRLLDCLRRRDADGAVASMTEHLDNLHQRYRGRAHHRQRARKKIN
ncbi:transcriptional regulator, GntR family [Enhydrobacter aerosaccus]|uniref:Transcriptional regulator, GntR family n=1 Tax=Enhydrobacter aerosaccus TaxID=225324 RepID=A0A1T4T0Z2_9HYPH|nr:FCD domain-containing protein [Enhydrobacter aerosaccus]SKA34144.1 transcriptional regulator, GntR family [Enhydrobacter aerosaccus]